MHNYTYSRIENGDIDDDEDDLDIEDMKDDDDDAGDCDTHWSKTAWHLHCSCYCSCNLGWVNKSTIPPSLFSAHIIYVILPYHHFDCTILKYSRNKLQAFNHFKTILWTSFYSTFHFDWSNINAERGPILMLGEGLVFHSYVISISSWLYFSLLSLSTTSSTTRQTLVMSWCCYDDNTSLWHLRHPVVDRSWLQMFQLRH